MSFGDGPDGSVNRPRGMAVASLSSVHLLSAHVPCAEEPSPYSHAKVQTSWPSKCSHDPPKGLQKCLPEGLSQWPRHRWSLHGMRVAPAAFGSI